MDKKHSIYFDKVSDIINAFSFEYKTNKVSEGGYYLDDFIGSFLAKAKKEKRIIDFEVRSICAHVFENKVYGALFVAIYTEECGLETIAVDYEEEHQ